MNLLTSPDGTLELPLIVHLVAFYIFGLTGALAAVKRGHDFIGLFAMAFATAAGGGLIRDGLFIQDGPPLITRHSEYIVIILISALSGVFLSHRINRFGLVIAWLDALGVSIYTVVGAKMALNAGLSVAASLIVGVITAAGGGLVRDLLAREEPLMLKPGQFYVLAATLGCGVYLACLHFEPSRPFAVITSIAVTFIIRVLAIQFNWTTAPVSRWNRHGDV